MRKKLLLQLLQESRMITANVLTTNLVVRVKKAKRAVKEKMQSLAMQKTAMLRTTATPHIIVRIISLLPLMALQNPYVVPLKKMAVHAPTTMDISIKKKASKQIFIFFFIIRAGSSGFMT
jgi:hypothetical protein